MTDHSYLLHDSNRSNTIAILMSLTPFIDIILIALVTALKT